MLAVTDTDPSWQGDGPAVLLLHAFPLTRAMWDDVIPLLSPVARVLAVDLPGLGGSDLPDGPPSLEAVCDALVAELDGRGVRQAVWVGISTGGYLTAVALGRHPSRVAAAALCSTTTLVIEPDEPAARLAVADELESTGSLAAVAGGAEEGFGATARRERPDLVERSAAMIAAQDPARVAWWCRALAARPDTSEVVAASTVPLALVFGEQDVATPPQRAHQLQALRPGAALTLLPGVGHLTPVEAPAAFAVAVQELLARL